MADKNIREIIEETNDSLFNSSEHLDKIGAQVSDITSEVQSLSNTAKGAESSLSSIGQSINVDASINRLVELERLMDALDAAYQEGKISLDDYNKSMSKLEVEADGLSSVLRKNGADVDALVAKTKEAKAEQDSLSESIQLSNKNVGEYEGSWEKVGATANTSLSIIAAAIRTSNPGLATMLGSVQKLIPNLVELGNAAKKTGSLMKAMTSSAGILTLITLLTTIITDFDNIAESIGVSTEKIETFKHKCGDVIQKVVGWLGGLGNTIYKTITAPIQGAIDAFTILKDKGLKGGKEAAQALANGYKEGWSFKKNFEAGQNVADTWVEGIRSRKKAATEAVTKEAKDVLGDAIEAAYKAVYNEFDNMDFLNLDGLDADIAAFKSKMDEWKDDSLKILAEWNARNESAMDKELTSIAMKKAAYIRAGVDEKEATEWAEKEKQKIRDKYAKEEADKSKEANDKREAAEKELHDLRMERNAKFLESTKGLFDGIADSLSDNMQAELEAGKITEEQYNKRMAVVKAFQIASIVADAASGIQSIWSAFAKEKIANTETAAATGPAAAVTLGVLNAKSLASAILQTGMIAATSAAGIASVTSGNKVQSTTQSVSASATPSVAATPTISQTYTLNSDYSADIADLKDSFKSQQVVLVVDDVTKVQSTSSRVQTQASF